MSIEGTYIRTSLLDVVPAGGDFEDKEVYPGSGFDLECARVEGWRLGRKDHDWLFAG